MADPRNRRMNALDAKKIAEYVHEEWQRRKSRRDEAGLPEKWREIDRHLRMDPEAKKTADGRPVAGTEWFPELELPLQAQTLELHVADIRRLMFPDDRNFFSVRALMDDRNLEKLTSRPLISGLDDNVEALLSEIGKKQIDQDTLDELNAAVLRHFHRMYRMRDRWDAVNAEAVKYGFGVGRALRVDVMKAFGDESGVHKKTRRIPAFVPRSIKNVFFDDNASALMNEGTLIEPAVIEWSQRRLDELKKAAALGSPSFDAENGGWLKKPVRNLEPKSKHDEVVDLLEYEGDLVVPRSDGEPIELYNVLCTVVVSHAGPEVIRLRAREFPFRSYVQVPYHSWDIETGAATSPLMLGAPIHKAATEALSRFLQTAALAAQPPVQWDPSDYYLESTGGPRIEPGAKWKASSKIAVHNEWGNSLGPMRESYLALLAQYENATGTTAPRLGAQTKSHQTAFAVDQELGRSQIRTVDFVNATMIGPVTQWLSMEFEMARRSLKDEPVYLDKYKSFVTLTGSDLADVVVFDVHGSAGPLKEREAQIKKLQALNLAVQIEIQKRQISAQTGEAMETLSLAALQKAVLADGGWDVDTVFAAEASGGSGSVPAGTPSGTALEDSTSGIIPLPSVA